MVKRLGLVAWWIGALLVGVAALCVVGGIIGAFISGRDSLMALWVAFLLLFPIAGCWAVSFILGGSFWRPPSLT